MLVDISWLVVGGSGWWWIYFGWWWVVVGGSGYILADGGWWWMVMHSGGWWWMVVGGGIVSSDPFFNENVVPQSILQKHLGMFLDSKLNFSERLKNIFQKTNKTIGLLQKFQTLLPSAPLITIYKSFIRPHLDHGGMIYDQTFNMLFHQKMELGQQNAVLVITGALRGSSREKLYQELGLETIQQRRCYRKLCCFYKILKLQCLKYLYSIIPILNVIQIKAM